MKMLWGSRRRPRRRGFSFWKVRRKVRIAKPRRPRRRKMCWAIPPTIQTAILTPQPEPRTRRSRMMRRTSASSSPCTEIATRPTSRTSLIIRRKKCRKIWPQITFRLWLIRWSSQRRRSFDRNNQLEQLLTKLKILILSRFLIMNKVKLLSNWEAWRWRFVSRSWALSRSPSISLKFTRKNYKSLTSKTTKNCWSKSRSIARCVICSIPDKVKCCISGTLVKTSGSTSYRPYLTVTFSTTLSRRSKRNGL